jgi:hypothetical protein
MWGYADNKINLNVIYSLRMWVIHMYIHICISIHVRILPACVVNFLSIFSLIGLQLLLKFKH